MMYSYFLNTLIWQIYADDSSPYEFSDSIDEVILKLQNESKSLIVWYENNYLKPNPDKWHPAFK